MKKQAFTLQHYALLSAGFLAAGRTEAQTGYYEFDPYFPMTFNEDVVVDLDMDGENDFGFFFRKEWSVSTGYGVNDFTFNMEQFGSHQVMVVPLDADFSFTIYSNTCYFPAATGVDKLTSFEVIGPDNEWDVAEIMARGESCTSYAFLKQGEWLFSGGQRDRFVGFRLSKPEHYYGWMRIRHNDSGNVDHIKDYFISPAPDTEVMTPEVDSLYAPAPEELSLFYAGDDLMVTFPRAADESKLQDYRVILRDAAFATPLTSEMCEITAPEDYMLVPKTGADDYTVNISALTRFWTGAAIEPGDMIKAYVYTKFDHPVTMLNGLSPESESVEYSASTDIPASDPDPVHAWMTGGMLIVQADGTRVQEISVYDLSGRSLLHYSGAELHMVNHFTIPFEPASGIYIVTVRDTTGALYSTKIFK